MHTGATDDTKKSDISNCHNTIKHRRCLIYAIDGDVRKTIYWAAAAVLNKL